ncbi:MAG: hypothetical protein ABJE10_21145 [bacterium]
MADLGSFEFLPWLRRGVASEITRDDGQPAPAGSDPARVDVPVSVTLNNTLTKTIPLSLIGPGEVTGVDRDAIIRIDPTPGVFDVESNYLPLLEFDQADFPWRYTPARAVGDRLTPWICLIVLRDDEIVSIVEAGNAGGLPVLSVEDADVLPSWNQLWAWAHVQVSGAKSLSLAEIDALLKAEPARAISRLLSPRRLEPNTPYTAFLVPTFERGRRAGVGETVPADLDALTPAWGEHGAVRLPVYFRWRFGTGAAGDFEFLVRQLVARTLPPSIGKRDMDVSAPGANLPPAFDAPLGLEGALSAIGMQRTDWLDTVRDQFVSELATLLNLPAQRLTQPGEDRAVVPPLYGRWHARAERLVPGAPPVWFNDLNQDPRERVAAGAGTKVIQQQQRQLMASAWRQVEGIRDANARLRLTQLARELALRVYQRHLAIGDADQLLQVSTPVLTRIMASPITIQARLHASPVLPGMLESQFRRITRPRGPVGRRQGRPLSPTPFKGFSRINDGDLVRPGPPVTPSTLITPQSAPPTLPPWATTDGIARLRFQASWFPVVGLILLVLGIMLASSSGWVVAIVLVGLGIALLVRGRQARERTQYVDVLTAFQNGSLSPEQMARAPARPDFVPVEGAPGAFSPDVPVTVRPAAGADNAAATAFRTAASHVLARISEPIETPPPLVRVAMEQLRTKVSVALDPRTTIVAGMHDMLQLPPDVVRQPTADPVEPIMAAPNFPQPMFAPLAAISQDFMLPGLDQVPPNTVTTVLTNQRFIEAYMAGLNHEMARELQWNEYPTDMRGTYFRQFWDPAGSAGDPAQLLDITPLNTWDNQSELGTHQVRTPPPGGEHLVLLVRGELFRRYPNTQVYAVKAKLVAAGNHELTDEELLPVFSGKIQPDVTFFGFQLTATDARGEKSTESPNQGWFFVLQEHPTEPRFGLDVAELFGGQPASWSDLSWGNLAVSDSDLSRIRYIDLTAPLPDTSLVNPTGGAHWHVAEGARASDLAFVTLQQPMRVAVHGADMIPAPQP